MSSNKWEELSEILSAEIKREIAENYFAEKVLIEEEWEEFKKELSTLKKLSQEIQTWAKRIALFLEDEELLKEFENATKFPISKLVDLKEVKNRKKEFVKELFTSLKLPAGFPRLIKCVRTIIWCYENIWKLIKDYKKEFKKMQKYHEILKDKTEEFHSRYDISFILNFFHKLDDKSVEFATPEDRERLLEELAKKMRIKVPPEIKEEFEEFEDVKSPESANLRLWKLGIKACKRNQDVMEEVLKVAS